MRPGTAPGALPEGRHTVPCQHPNQQTQFKTNQREKETTGMAATPTRQLEKHNGIILQRGGMHHWDGSMSQRAYSAIL